MSLSERIAIGIDICKSSLDVFHGRLQQHRQFSNAPQGVAELIDWLNEHGPVDIVVL